MKILLISHFFPPQQSSGAEIRTLLYATELQKLGHTIQVLCAGEFHIGDENYNGYTDDIYQGIQVRRVLLNWKQGADPNRYLYDNPNITRQMSEWLDLWKPDVVHIISLLTLSTSIIPAIKQHNIPIVATLVDFWFICPKISLVRGNGSLCDGQTSDWECLSCLLWETRAYRATERIIPEKILEPILTWVSRQKRINKIRGFRGLALDMKQRRQAILETAQYIDYVIVPSAFLAKVITSMGVFSCPIHVLHSGHDLSWLDTMPPKSTPGHVRIGFLGQLIAVKGLDFLIHAFQTAKSSRHAELWIYGDKGSDPGYYQHLQDLTAASANIHFKGAFNRNQLGEVLASLDVVVVPSQWHENNPRVIQEALASKTPVIASDVGGIAEFIQHEVNGLLFHHSSVEALRSQIERVLTEPGLIARLTKGITSVKTIAEEMDEIEAIYQKLFPGAV